MNLVNKVVPLADLEAEGVPWADEILEMSPTAIRFLKAVVPGRHRRPRRAAGVRRQRDGSLLHDRRGARGLAGVPREAQARLPQVPAAPLMTRRPVPPAATAAPPAPFAVSIWVHAARPEHAARRARRAWSWGSAPGSARARRSASTPRSAASRSRCCSRSLANFANDLSDFRRGADTAARQGPMRVAAAGLVTRAPAGGRDRDHDRRSRASWGCGWSYVGGPVLLGAGRAGRRRRARVHRRAVPVRLPGLGEVFVFVFFGLVAVVGTAYLQAAAARRRCSSPRRCPPGALITAILVVNNLRDIPTDTRGRQAHARGDARASAATQGSGCALAGGGLRRRRVLLGGRGLVRGPLLAPARAAAARSAAAAVADRPRVHRAPGAQPGAQGDGAARRCWSRCCSRSGWRRVALDDDDRARSTRDKVLVPFQRPFPTGTGMWLGARGVDHPPRGRGRAGGRGRGGARAGGRGHGVDGPRPSRPRAGGRAPVGRPARRRRSSSSTGRPGGRCGPRSTRRGSTSGCSAWARRGATRVADGADAAAPAAASA